MDKHDVAGTGAKRGPKFSFSRQQGLKPTHPSTHTHFTRHVNPESLQGGGTGIFTISSFVAIVPERQHEQP